MLIGSLNWAVTLGRFDVHYAASTMGRYQPAPRDGHLQSLLKAFGYLKYHRKRKLIFDAGFHEVPVENKVETQWGELYPDAKEELPPDMPVPKGNPVQVTTSYDANHAHDLDTRRSVSGILLFLNKTPVQSYCKRQGTVESFTYGSELMASRIATELTMAMRYRLRMLGVPLQGPAHLYGDNMSVIVNCLLASSSLKKKHNAIAYHKVREAVAAGVIKLFHIPSSKNKSDILTKLLGPIKHYNHMKTILV